MFVTYKQTVEKETNYFIVKNKKILNNCQNKESLYTRVGPVLWKLHPTNASSQIWVEKRGYFPWSYFDTKGLIFLGLLKIKRSRRNKDSCGLIYYSTTLHIHINSACIHICYMYTK